MGRGTTLRNRTVVMRIDEPWENDVIRHIVRHIGVLQRRRQLGTRASPLDGVPPDEHRRIADLAQLCVVRCQPLDVRQENAARGYCPSRSSARGHRIALRCAVLCPGGAAHRHRF